MNEQLRKEIIGHIDASGELACWIVPYLEGDVAHLIHEMERAGEIVVDVGKRGEPVYVFAPPADVDLQLAGSDILMSDKPEDIALRRTFGFEDAPVYPTLIYDAYGIVHSNPARCGYNMEATDKPLSMAYWDCPVCFPEPPPVYPTLEAAIAASNQAFIEDAAQHGLIAELQAMTVLSDISEDLSMTDVDTTPTPPAPPRMEHIMTNDIPHTDWPADVYTPFAPPSVPLLPATCPVRTAGWASTAPLGMPKGEGIDWELAEQGLRRALSSECGWYADTTYGTVWATDLPEPEPIVPVPMAKPRIPLAVQQVLEAAQKQGGKVSPGWFRDTMRTHPAYVAFEAGYFRVPSVEELAMRDHAYRLTEAGRYVLEVTR